MVIPLHNKGPHIERALRSVYQQTFRDFEVVVVDDASSDDGRDIVERIRDTNTRLLRRDQPGPGGYAARNVGIKAAANPWIAFLDADDEWMPEHLGTLVGLQACWPDLFCFAATYERDYGEGNRVLCSYAHHAGGRVRRIGFAEYIRETARDRCPVWTSAMSVHKDVLFRAGLFPEDRCTRGGDVETWLRIVELTDVGWSPAIGARYHRDSINMVTRQTAPQIHHCVDATIADMVRRRSANGRLAAVSATSLRRLANYYKRPAIKRAIRSGEIVMKDVRRLYFSADPFLFAAATVAAAAPKSLLSWALSVASRGRHAKWRT